VVYSIEVIVPLAIVIFCGTSALTRLSKLSLGVLTRPVVVRSAGGGMMIRPGSPHVFEKPEHGDTVSAIRLLFVI